MGGGHILHYASQRHNVQDVLIGTDAEAADIQDKAGRGKTCVAGSSCGRAGLSTSAEMGMHAHRDDWVTELGAKSENNLIDDLHSSA